MRASEIKNDWRSRLGTNEAELHAVESIAELAAFRSGAELAALCSAFLAKLHAVEEWTN